MIQIQQAKTFLAKCQGKKEMLEKLKQDAEEESIRLARKKKLIEKARNIINLVALQTQKQLEIKISSVVCHALASVFDDPYDFVVQFEDKRGKTECNLLFQRGEALIDPLDASGFGAVDIASLALRIACHTLDNVPPVLVLDEPFKHLKGTETNKRAIQMLKEVSKELGIQIITISDERADREAILSGADSLIVVSQNKKKESQVEIFLNKEEELYGIDS